MVTARVPPFVLGCVTGIWLYVPRVPPLEMVLAGGTRRRSTASLVSVPMLRKFFSDGTTLKVFNVVLSFYAMSTAPIE